MQITLVMNPDAGDGDLDEDSIVSKLERQGGTVRSVDAKSRRLRKQIEEPADLIIVAGGDGTVAKVARLLSGRATPMHILAAGTANNIAQSLGIRGRELDLGKLTERWQTISVDAIEVDDELVIESAGCGAIAHLIRSESDQGRSNLHDERKTLAEHVTDLPLFDYRIEVDGVETAGEAVLIEAMIIRQIGPRVELARNADPSDGFLDLVVVHDEKRETLSRYLRARRKNPPALPVVRGRSVTIACDAPWHFDDEARRRHTRTLTVRRGAWNVIRSKSN